MIIIVINNKSRTGKCGFESSSFLRKMNDGIRKFVLFLEMSACNLQVGKEISGKSQCDEPYRIGFRDLRLERH